MRIVRRPLLGRIVLRLNAIVVVSGFAKGKPSCILALARFVQGPASCARQYDEGLHEKGK